MLSTAAAEPIRLPPRLHSQTTSQRHSRRLTLSFSAYFREEIEITIADMRSSNWEAALTRFEGRIGSTHLSEVTRGLIEMVRGSDTSVYWENLSIRFSEYQKQQLRTIALKIPPKINRMSMVLLFVMLLLYVVVLGTTMFDSFGTLFAF